MQYLNPLLTRFEKSLLIAALLLLAPACTQSSNSPTPMPDLAYPIPKDAIDLNAGPVMVSSGMERTVCVTGQFPLTVPVDIVQIATRQISSHHVIFYKFQSGATPPVNSTPIDCPPLDLLSDGAIKMPLFIGESADQSQNVLTLPPGVAYHFDPGDYYKIEIHVVNATQSDIAATVDVYLSPAEPNAQSIYADMLFLNDVSGLQKSYDSSGNKGLPPMAQTQIDPVFAPVSSDYKIFGITTHEHHLGTSVSVAASTGVNDPGTPLFTNLDWQHPTLYRLPDAQPLTFSAGQGLRWICNYNNTTTNYVVFGQSAITNEMCIIWAYYYPSAGFQMFTF